VTGCVDIPVRVVARGDLRRDVVELAGLLAQAAEAVEASTVLAHEKRFKKAPVGKEVERLDVHRLRGLGLDYNAVKFAG
jgi:hypothetical protein